MLPEIIDGVFDDVVASGLVNGMCLDEENREYCDDKRHLIDYLYEKNIDEELIFEVNRSEGDITHYWDLLKNEPLSV